MKKLIILLLLSYNLLAQNISHTIPLALQKKLCDQLAYETNRCENGSTLDYYTHTTLDDDKLLLFVYLNEHSRRFGNLHNATPILIDKLGRWTSTVGANIISENIESIHQDPHGNIWVRAMWESEGVYPNYYHSADGLHWKNTVLPKNRNVDCCFESVEKPIFLLNTITLTFKSLNKNNTKSWAANYQSAMSNTPVWQPLSTVPQNGMEIVKNNNWKVIKTKDKITFINPYSNKELYLSLPSKNNKTVYQIQIGAYINPSSALKVQKSLNALPYFTHIEQNQKYTKLFIGTYTTIKKAKFMLAKIKREYPNNKTLQKAFILTSKP